MWRESKFVVLWSVLVMPFAMIIPTASILYRLGVEPLRQAIYFSIPINLVIIVTCLSLASAHHDRKRRRTGPTD